MDQPTLPEPVALSVPVIERDVDAWYVEEASLYADVPTPATSTDNIKVAAIDVCGVEELNVNFTPDDHVAGGLTFDEEPLIVIPRGLVGELATTFAGLSVLVKSTNETVHPVSGVA